MAFTVSENFLLDLSMKGERTYLRGADIFTECLKFIPSYDALSMLFRRKMVGEISIEPVAQSSNHDARFCGSMRCIIRDKTYDFGMLEDVSKPVIHRLPYDEAEVISGCDLDEKNAVIAFSYVAGGASFMDYVVALNKALLNQCVSSDVKWAFSKLELIGYPRFGVIKLQLKNQMGLRLVKSAIYVDDVLFGHIYFSDFAGHA